MSDTTNINATDRLAFQAFSAQVGAHPACGHKLFSVMAEQAAKGTLNAGQVDIFTRAMMARIYRTMPNIAGLVQTALLNGDGETAHTAMHNLEEEMNMGGQTHQQMAQEAFNVLRKGYGLAPLTMKEAHDAVPLPDSYTQEQLWVSGYRDFPAIASWLQERASGGTSDNQKGMMADMFALFEACRESVGPEFKTKVLPYFAAHNRIVEEEGRYRIAFDPSGVEFQHGARAEKDAMREYASLPAEQRGHVETMARAFLDAQDRLFSAIGVQAGVGAMAR